MIEKRQKKKDFYTGDYKLKLKIKKLKIKRKNTKEKRWEY